MEASADRMAERFGTAVSLPLRVAALSDDLSPTFKELLLLAAPFGRPSHELSHAVSHGPAKHARLPVASNASEQGHVRLSLAGDAGPATLGHHDSDPLALGAVKAERWDCDHAAWGGAAGGWGAEPAHDLSAHASFSFDALDSAAADFASYLG